MKNLIIKIKILPELCLYSLSKNKIISNFNPTIGIFNLIQIVFYSFTIGLW